MIVIVKNDYQLCDIYKLSYYVMNQFSPIKSYIVYARYDPYSYPR